MQKAINKRDSNSLTYSIEEVAEVLGISRATAYNLANSKGFPVLRIGKRMVVPKEALAKWMEQQTNIGA